MKNFLNRLMYGRSNRPDLTKEDMNKQSSVSLFFEILGIKYLELIKLNLLLIMFAIPIIIWTSIYWSMLTDPALEEGVRNFISLIYFAGLIPCLLILAPPLAGVSYIIRNFTQDKHAWLWSDFIKHAKANMKQSLMYMFMFTLFVCFGQITMYLYSSFSGAGAIIFVMRALFIALYSVVMLSIIYVFPMMVTYELNLKDIIKNSLLLTVAKFPQTILFVILALLPTILFLLLSTVTGVGVIFLVFYLLFFGLTFAMYVLISYTTATFDKFLNKETSHDDEINTATEE